MLITGIDLETTGLDTNTNKIIEVGLVLWDTDRKMPLNMYNELVFIRHDLPEEITKITGITDRDLKLYGTELNERIYEELYFYFNEADYIVAHNGNLFDKPMLINNLACYDLVLPDKPWIDTSCDIAFPDSMKTRNLKHLACEHNFINPFAHRALFDVLTMLNMVSKYDFNEIIKYAETPNIQVRALCQAPWEDDGKSTNEAKANGFRWDGAKKIWVKNIKSNQLESEEKKTTLYRIVQI